MVKPIDTKKAGLGEVGYGHKKKAEHDDVLRLWDRVSLNAI